MDTVRADHGSSTCLNHGLARITGLHGLGLAWQLRIIVQSVGALIHLYMLRGWVILAALDKRIGSLGTGPVHGFHRFLICRQREMNCGSRSLGQHVGRICDWRAATRVRRRVSENSVLKRLGLACFPLVSEPKWAGFVSSILVWEQVV